MQFLYLVTAILLLAQRSLCQSDSSSATATASGSISSARTASTLGSRTATSSASAAPTTTSSPSAPPSYCASSTASASATGSATATASQCPYGSVRSGSSNRCEPCKPGYFDTILNSSLSRSCAPCPPGYGSENIGSVYCTACPLGYFSPGGSVCLPCPANSFNDKLNASACTLCPDGTDTRLSIIEGGLQVSPGSCERCELKTISKAGGPCEPCPPGSITVAQGQSTCVFLKPQCNPGFMPKAPLLDAVLKQTMCLPISCPAFMSLTKEKRACRGCPPGSFGNISAGCVACSELAACSIALGGMACKNVTCPGFLPLPLAAAPAALAAPAQCVAGSSLAFSERVFGVPPTQAALAYIGVYIAVGVVCIFFLVLYRWQKSRRLQLNARSQSAQGAGIRDNSLAPTASGTKAWPSKGYSEVHDENEWKTDFFRFSDRMFALRGLHGSMHPEAPRGTAPPPNTTIPEPPKHWRDMLVTKRTPIGGLCFVLALVTVGAQLAIYSIQYVFSNVGTSVSLEQLMSMQSALPWASVAAGLGGEALLPPLAPGVNLQLRLFGQAALGCGAPLSLDFAGVPGVENVSWRGAEPWLLQSQFHPLSWIATSTPCGGSPNVSLLLLSCLGCELAPDSFISVALPPTCQSFHLEVVAVDGAGNLRALELDKRFSSASPTGQLLSTIDWFLQPTLSWLDVTAGAPLSGSSAAAPTSARGYAISASAASSATANPATDLPDGGLLPLENAIVVTVHLPLQPTVLRKQVFPIKTPIDMLSLFSSALVYVGTFGGWLACMRFVRSIRQGKSKKASSPLTSKGGLVPPSKDDDGGVEVQVNPLFSANPRAGSERLWSYVPAAGGRKEYWLRGGVPAGDGEEPREGDKAVGGWECNRDETDMWWVRGDESVWELPAGEAAGGDGSGDSGGAESDAAAAQDAETVAAATEVQRRVNEAARIAAERVAAALVAEQRRLDQQALEEAERMASAEAEAREEESRRAAAAVAAAQEAASAHSLAMPERAAAVVRAVDKFAAAAMAAALEEEQRISAEAAAAEALDPATRAKKAADLAAAARAASSSWAPAAFTSTRRGGRY